jgi:hypothetical protein
VKSIVSSELYPSTIVTSTEFSPELKYYLIFFVIVPVEAVKLSLGVPLILIVTVPLVFTFLLFT